MKKEAFCICDNKDEPRYEKRGFLHMCVITKTQISCTVDQRLCFRYINRTIPLLLTSEISRL